MESRGSPSAGYRVADRRPKPRIHEPFAARVRGVDGRGDSFEAEAVLQMKNDKLHARNESANPSSFICHWSLAKIVPVYFASLR